MNLNIKSISALFVAAIICIQINTGGYVQAAETNKGSSHDGILFFATSISSRLEKFLNENGDWSSQGYKCVEYDGSMFLAAGSRGRLDRIGLDMQVENLPVPTREDLLDITVHNDLILVSGTGGTILFSTDGEQFLVAETDVSTPLYSMAYFNGYYFAGTDRGVVLSSKDGQVWNAGQTGTNHNIVSIAANDAMLMAVTRESDIITSADGINWAVENFNQIYDGYYEPFTFTNITAMGSMFFVTGHQVQNENIPHMMMSDTGEVWTLRPLENISGIDYEKPVSIKINAVGYDLDQLLLACNNGQILTVSDCYKCNKVDTFGEADLSDLAFGGDKLIIVGDAYEFDLLDGTAARQYNIKPEQAYEDLLTGAAVIIDVRTDEEYTTGHIPGCLHIPVDQIEQRLREEVPDLEAKLIFYCQGGGRAQMALETALELGYERVYNLGGFPDWPYTVE